MIHARAERACAQCAHWSESRRHVRSFLIGAAAGAALGHLLDPERGRHRRRLVRERSAGAVRHAGRHCARTCRGAALRTLGHAKGAIHRLRPPAPEPLDDAGLAHKVESVFFRDSRVPKGKISINAESGTVFLRGQLESPELIDDLGGAVRNIPGVDKVVNLLHLPGTEAPHPPADPRVVEV